MGNGRYRPCSEIFYDHGDHIPGGRPARLMKMVIGLSKFGIWSSCSSNRCRINALIYQDRRLTQVWAERVAAVLQGKHDNYDIDLMRALIEASAEVSGTTADGDHNISHRVVVII